MHSCKTCDHWHEIQDSEGWGHCKKNAPVPSFVDSKAAWPITENTDVCGEYSMNGKELKKLMDSIEPPPAPPPPRIIREGLGIVNPDEIEGFTIKKKWWHLW